LDKGGIRRIVIGPLYNASFDGALLSRGFWLYVWEILAPDGRTVHYVGKTGDKASRASQSPFNRLANHLGSNKHSNALTRYLGQMKLPPETCHFRFHAYGPLFEEKSHKTHGELCDVTSALEKGLADAMTEVGYVVINKVHCRTALDASAFAAVRTAFAAHFDKLSSGNAGTTTLEFATVTKNQGGHR
jgi:hypothetical protein